MPVTSSTPASTAGAATESLPDAHDWFGSRGWAQWTTATGDWASMRTTLADRGLDFSVLNISDVSSLTAAEGGRATMARSLFGGGIAADLTKLAHVPGGKAYMQLQWRGGANGSAMLGDLQVFSNIDASIVPHLGEAWYEQQFGPRVRAKAGRIDANREFATLSATGDFLSSAMAFSPSIDGLPTYPNPSSGAALFVNAGSHLHLAGAMFDGTPEDREWVQWNGGFEIAQAGTDWQLPGGSLAGAATLGWFGINREDGRGMASGVYANSEQTLWDGDRSGSVFVQAGHSDARCAIKAHFATGIAMRGLSSRRSHDVTGIGTTWALVEPSGADPATELVVEAFHRVALSPALSLIPDAQWVHNPSGDTSRGTSLVWTLRVRVDM